MYRGVPNFRWTFMKIKHLPRPHNQRAFVSWLAENYTRFSVSVRINRITATSVTLIFPDYPACLSVSLCEHSLNVVVDWQGLNWDMLISLDAYIARTVNGYQCQLCIVDDTESPQLFPSREALWIDHLYEPFLKWVNEELASARWLQISGSSDGGITCAQLIQAESGQEKNRLDFAAEGGDKWTYFTLPLMRTSFDK